MIRAKRARRAFCHEVAVHRSLGPKAFGPGLCTMRSVLKVAAEAPFSHGRVRILPGSRSLWPCWKRMRGVGAIGEGAEDSRLVNSAAVHILPEFMDSSKLALFVLATAGLAFLPGPNTTLTISRSISQGRLAGVKVLLGIEAGFLVHLIAVSTGFTALLVAVPAAYTAMRTAGCAYLLYIAYRIIRTPNTWRIDSSLARESTRRLVASGFLSNVLNPKAAMFYLSVFPQFLTPGSSSILSQILTLGVVHIVVSSACNLIYIMASGSLALVVRKHPIWERCQRWLFGTLIGFFALEVLLPRRAAATK
jgi:threonine/homoserine/homoserine lactone efflux protein